MAGLKENDLITSNNGKRIFTTRGYGKNYGGE
jgi:S1-C subfamily serine protease